MSNRAQALKVLKRLRQEGYQALFAGGCVRDYLLGRRPKDYDVVTNAVPDQIIPLFRKTLKIGARFGVVIVILEGKQVEVATFRTESDYQDGRHPEKVEFATAKEDAMRRDFTVNGMFFDPISRQTLDFVGGREDLQKKIIRTIGNPDERFGEDYLRLLRAVRFAVQLDFEIEEQTWQAVCRHAPKISQISPERIAMELEQILTHPNRARGARLLNDSGLAQTIFPGFEGPCRHFGGKMLRHLPEQIDFPLALAAYFTAAPVNKSMEWAKSLRLSNSTIKHIRYLLEHKDVLADAELPLAQLKMLMAEPYWEDLVHLRKALLLSEGQSISPLKTIQKRAAALKGKILRPKPLLDGHQLIALGAVPGPMVGRLARELYIAQLAEEIQTPHQARRWVQQWLEKHAEPKNE
ncbi:MAG TPA: CCA tRNA nucleotidyltransferase [Anaerohalosphaeraceae bacterium]|nr:CCA tRNA nucleotidyltransferase [Anaerohalosphaeraceae bacterium]HOL88459.1 CCA tRNA nucleotidyltransferase [Anaerohalosphaeraceae bacterium]HPP56964.1 CCA tRNA nucleotidyltransferase [Anaerohalosphaeraceae bacterium]